MEYPFGMSASGKGLIWRESPKAAIPTRTGKYSLLAIPDRKSTRLNSSHQIISYAVFCLKKKKENNAKVVRHADTSLEQLAERKLPAGGTVSLNDRVCQAAARGMCVMTVAGADDETASR